MPTPQRTFTDQLVEARLWNTRLAGALAVCAVLILALTGLTYRAQARAATVKPILIQVDQLGRHAVIDQDLSLTSDERERVIRADLTQFVRQHFSRRHGAVSEAFAQSLYFLEPSLSDAVYRKDNPEVVKFLNSPSAEEINIAVQNVSLPEVTKTGGKAQVSFEKTYIQPKTHEPTKKAETYVVSLDFALHPDVPAAYVPVNPLGLQITYFRVDQAFQ